MKWRTGRAKTLHSTWAVKKIRRTGSLYATPHNNQPQGTFASCTLFSAQMSTSSQVCLLILCQTSRAPPFHMNLSWTQFMRKPQWQNGKPLMRSETATAMLKLAVTYYGSPMLLVRLGYELLSFVRLFTMLIAIAIGSSSAPIVQSLSCPQPVVRDTKVRKLSFLARRGCLNTGTLRG